MRPLLLAFVVLAACTTAAADNERPILQVHLQTDSIGFVASWTGPLAPDTDDTVRLYFAELWDADADTLVVASGESTRRRYTFSEQVAVGNSGRRYVRVVRRNAAGNLGAWAYSDTVAFAVPETIGPPASDVQLDSVTGAVRVTSIFLRRPRPRYVGGHRPVGTGYGAGRLLGAL